MRERITCVDIVYLNLESDVLRRVYIYIYHRSHEGVNSGFFQPLSHKWIPRLPLGLS